MGQKITIGVAYRDLDRKEADDSSRLGYNEHSWSLNWSGTGFSMWHAGKETQLSSTKARRLGVYLDQHEGVLAFYRISNNQAHLIHSLQTDFTGPLYPGFCFWSGVGASVTLSIVLLCLLGAALANEYSWNSPGETTKDSKTENLCLADQASCGCCLMQKQMWRMEQFFNMSLNELQKGLEKAKAMVNNVRASRSAFSVALTNTRRCEGPFREAKTIVYQHIFVNLGEGYNNRTGIFTVPRSGVYSLALTVYSDSGAPGANLAACASLMVNGRQVAGCSEQNQQDQEDSTTTVMAVQLQAGDKLSVTLPIGCFLCDEQSHYNTFSGFLLYATD
ncbi:cerebellin 20 [Salvelinus alpinus]|uniref:cerebellin 20 n=1 Tax=Salvelinus alpinus TaxID=8036 RepID=UPI0039FC1BDA